MSECGRGQRGKARRAPPILTPLTVDESVQPVDAVEDAQGGAKVGDAAPRVQELVVDGLQNQVRDGLEGKGGE